MKIFKRILAVSLVLIMQFCLFSISTAAQSETISVRMLNYNVAGLPKFGKTDGNAHHTAIAQYIVKNAFDIVAVQEDFAYNKSLVKGLTGFDYFTNHSGSIPGGDGLNIFTDGMALYNEERYQWDASFGDISEGDVLTAKGILYAVIEISEGVYIDFYNIHADAFDTLGSVEARKSNFNQVAKLIEENCEKYHRPVILTGDFNSYFDTTTELDSNIYEIFYERCGLKDAWVELHNNGDYHNFSSWGTHEVEADWWGIWDSIERFMYKDGDGVTVRAAEFNYTEIKNSEGEELSDHSAAESVFEFTVSEDYKPAEQDLKIVKVSPFRNIFNTIKWIIKDLIYMIRHFGDMIEFFS